MQFHMDGTLRFWVNCSYQAKRDGNARACRADTIAEILRDYERAGDAMRYLNAKRQIAWKASASMLQRLADAEREVTEDLEGICDDDACS